eukprot:1576459-Prymnesium_polylepis.1
MWLVGVGRRRLGQRSQQEQPRQRERAQAGRVHRPAALAARPRGVGLGARVGLGQGLGPRLGPVVGLVRGLVVRLVQLGPHGVRRPIGRSVRRPRRAREGEGEGEGEATAARAGGRHVARRLAAGRGALGRGDEWAARGEPDGRVVAPHAERSAERAERARRRAARGRGRQGRVARQGRRVGAGQRGRA